MIKNDVEFSVKHIGLFEKVFVDPKDAKRYASSSDPSKDWSEHLGVGMYALVR